MKTNLQLSESTKIELGGFLIVPSQPYGFTHEV